MPAALALSAALTGCGGTPDPAPAANLAGPCPVTAPGAELPFGDGGFNHGKPDGSIRAKLGWWRAVEAGLSIEGDRLDASAPPLRVAIPHGYGPSGFQATDLIFPTPGCWQVVASVGDASLKFAVSVSRR
jgi:hypothetical protein